MGTFLFGSPSITPQAVTLYLAVRLTLVGTAVMVDWFSLSIRRTVGDSQSIVVVPVTGSLVSPTLFSRRDADFGDRSSRDCINCDTDWILPTIYQVLLLKHTAGGTMDAAMGCTGDGDRPDIEWYGATAKRSGRFRDERSSGQCDRESHSTRERRP